MSAETDLIVNHRRRMPELDSLAPAEKEARFDVVATKALEQYGLSPDTLTCLFHSDGLTYKVESGSQSETYLLRIHTGVGTHYSSVFCGKAGIQSPMLWQLALSEQTPLTVQIPLRTNTGELVAEVANDDPSGIPYLCSLVTWIPGRERDVESREQAYELGRIAGILHRHVASWSLPSEFERAEWDAPQTIGYLHELQPYVEEGGRVSPTVYSLAERACVLVEEKMAAVPKTPDNWGLIHGELGWSGNCVYHNGIGSPIDFNSCAFGHYMHDLAKILWFVRYEFREGVIKAYGEEMSLPKDHMEQLMVFYMAEMIFRTGTRAQVSLDVIMTDVAEHELSAGLQGEYGVMFEPPDLP